MIYNIIGTKINNGQIKNNNVPNIDAKFIDVNNHKHKSVDII